MLQADMLQALAETLCMQTNINIEGCYGIQTNEARFMPAFFYCIKQILKRKKGPNEAIG